VESRDAVEAAAIGEGEGAHAELGRAVDEVFGVARGFEEGEGAGAAELDVVGVARGKAMAGHPKIFATFSPPVNDSRSGAL
jgi:hypothetical protein